MAVQIASSDRPALNTSDPLGGDVTARADAYSSYLAYFGTYTVQGETVVHDIDRSLFPNWSSEQQVRPLAFEHDELILKTPPMPQADGTIVVNELAWSRTGRRSDLPNE
jgi:hypothetical protein